MKRATEKGFEYAHEEDTPDLQAMFKTIIARLDAIDEVIESPPFRPFNLAPLSDENRAKLEKEQEERQAKAETLEQQQKLLALLTMALVERAVVALEKIGSAADRYATSNEKAIDVATRGVVVLEAHAGDHSTGATVSDSE